MEFGGEYQPEREALLHILGIKLRKRGKRKRNPLFFAIIDIVLFSEPYGNWGTGYDKKKKKVNPKAPGAFKGQEIVSSPKKERFKFCVPMLAHEMQHVFDKLDRLKEPKANSKAKDFTKKIPHEFRPFCREVMVRRRLGLKDPPYFRNPKGPYPVWFTPKDWEKIEEQIRKFIGEEKR